MPRRLASSPLFMINDFFLHVHSLKSAGLEAEYADIDLESWNRISPSSQILHFSEMLVTILTALKLDVAGVLHWQLQFYWCCAAQDVHSHYISRHRKCNSVSECIRRKEPFKVQGKCHDFLSCWRRREHLMDPLLNFETCFSFLMFLTRFKKPVDTSTCWYIKNQVQTFILTCAGFPSPKSPQ